MAKYFCPFLLVCLSPLPLCAQFRDTPILPKNLDLLTPSTAIPSTTQPAVEKPGRIPLFRIQPGFLKDPVGLEQEEASASGGVDDGPDWVSVAVGNDNPFFDMRKRGDPGGFGYARLNTQVQLFDTPKTACSVVFQAYTPAGLEFDGLPDRLGPTVVMPALSLFHQLDDGTAVHAYVGKNWLVQTSQQATAPIRRDVQYGMALQHPLVKSPCEFLGELFVSVGALGQYRQGEAIRGLEWDLMPGLQWKVADNWWLSGGVMVPISNQRQADQQLWQVTCSMQF